jgi:4-hydroxy-tetrahydrodipicolinate synthase
VVSHLCGPDLKASCDAWFAGEAAEALRLFLRTLPLTRAVFSTPSPSPLKYAMEKIGQPVGGVRLPLVDLTEAEQRVVNDALAEYGTFRI